MSVLLCRCCGARLEIKSGVSVCKCEYCGVLQTVPILDFDEKALLWERADGMRRSGEYDRAMSVYKQIAVLCPDEPDVYWAMVLCRYGVEYVEEPLSHKRIPTINRIQYTPVIDDEDYRKSVKFSSNGDQRRIYILEAQKLDELRGKILAVSLDEKPYDIFICYKETDKDGRRTEDSVLAAKLYRALSAEGWRVFFSRVTLESKAGTEYEPYIFAALNSAKLMLVVGTTPDNINAVWVKNEWSRYLARVGENGEGMLIPLYKGMLKEHLPVEFNHLQAFDMAVPDFEEELIRGIRKILAKAPAKTSETKSSDLPADTSGLLRRAELFLEDGDFARADELCETVLDAEPENARAYLIKLLAEYHIPSQDRLHECREDFSLSGNFAKAMRFGDENLQIWLEDELALCRYETFSRELENAYNESQFLAIAKRFDTIADYADSMDKAAFARKRAAEISEKKAAEENESLYKQAVKLLENKASKSVCVQALALLERLVGYKDSDELAKRCNSIISEIDDKEAQAAAQKEAAAQSKKVCRKRAKKITLISGAGAVCAAAGIIAAVNISGSVSLSNRYKAAEDYLANGSFDRAISEYTELGDYSDAAEKLTLAQYNKAVQLYENGSFAEAESAFEALGDYSKSKEYLLRSKYGAAEQTEIGGSFAQAAQMFAALGEFSDSPERADECLYKEACRLSEKKDYTSALDIFGTLGSYRDSEAKVKETTYLRANSYLQNGQYEEALNDFLQISGYSNSAQKIKETYYLQGKKLLADKQFEDAIKSFGYANGYSNSAALVVEAKYQYAQDLAAKQKYRQALELYENLDGYKDAAELVKQVKYSFAEQLRETGYYDDAVAQFTALGDYSDAAEQIAKTLEAKRRDVKQGDVITLGGWVQGKKGEYQPLEWIVLKREGGRALVTTKYLVDFMPYGALTWKDSSVRSWLNGTFYNGAFTETDKKAISETLLADTQTTDKVFILNQEEAFGCLSDETLRTDYTQWGEKKLREAIEPTLPAGASYASMFGDPYWLRDIGDEMRVCILNNVGNFWNRELYTERNGVRPAMWIELGEL